ncbi:site-2 protease family protein [Halolamina sp. CBA1230]|uniref:site-2 protease family protein n=1 Tax=Halolamina sp. CBA1230 TaxID=1853690 RepID=UPI0009A1D8B8|nr:site-2 protease family protein [Halolamina sp. CBA1230]QKY21055.1 site-2 protease family protein [Halolamina sp. CBA1230]
MADRSGSDEIPRPEALDAWFHLTAIQRDGDRIRYHGESLVPRSRLADELIPAFEEAGYELRFSVDEAGNDVLVARPIGAAATSETNPTLNVALLIATVFTTMFVGATVWYYIPLSAIAENPLRVLEAWPFTAAVLGVLLTHEMGHYLAGRRHGVDVSLPYVIPFYVPFGTMGAVIRMRSRVPDREALLDIGAAGPLAGLIATIVVTAIGVSLDPMTVPQRVLQGSGEAIIFHNPPLLDLIANALGQETGYDDPSRAVHPVVMGGWIGMFFTVLNLLPVGQLDGGHILRAVLGDRQETVAALVPGALFGLAGYLWYVRDMGMQNSVGLWLLWGFITLLVSFGGAADPIDETPVGWKRVIVAGLTFALGALCFLPVPIEIATV